MVQEPFKLLIIDSVMANLRTDYSGVPALCLHLSAALQVHIAVPHADNTLSACREGRTE